MDSDWIVAIVLVVFIGGIVVVATWQEYKSRHKRCPRCGKGFGLKLVKHVEAPKPGSKVVNLRLDDWLCKYCGYTEHKESAVNHFVKSSLPRPKHYEDKDESNGGSSSGGSFGGGYYGGGGAGGKF